VTDQDAKLEKSLEQYVSLSETVIKFGSRKE
jgi:hypothetical protein